MWNPAFARRHDAHAMGTSIGIIGPDAPGFERVVRAVEETFGEEEQRYSRFRPTSELSGQRRRGKVDNGLRSVRCAPPLHARPRATRALRPHRSSRDGGGRLRSRLRRGDRGGQGGLAPHGGLWSLARSSCALGPSASRRTSALTWAASLRDGPRISRPSARSRAFRGCWSRPVAISASPAMPPSSRSRSRTRDEADRWLGALRLRTGAIATSSTRRRSWGPGLHHVIDPRSGAPSATGVDQATVWAPTCAEAEITSTVALLEGSKEPSPGHACSWPRTAPIRSFAEAPPARLEGSAA